MDKTTVLITNKQSGKKIPIKHHIINKLIDVKHAELAFKRYAATWDHGTITGAEIYVSLLDKWDAAITEFMPYANIYYVARYGLSLN